MLSWHARWLFQSVSEMMVGCNGCAEMDLLRPWYELSKVRRRGRSLVGISELDPSQNVEKLAGLIDSGELASISLKRAVRYDLLS